ncbi:MAG TPA: CbtA family protein [Kineosporiaceae bacterium]
MARTFLVRGLAVGLAAGLAAFVFAWVFAEPSITAAIGFESAHSAPNAHDPELFSRTVQSTVGLAVAVLVYSTALGGIFGVVFAFAYGRLGPLDAYATALVVAVLGFVTAQLVPFLKYPANPPSIGNSDTIGRRTTLYFAMIAISVLAGILAVLLARTWSPRTGTPTAVLAAVGVFVVVVSLCAWGLPGVDEVPADFPATLLWQFRLASLGTQAVTWTTLGVGFGAWTHWRLRAGAASSAARVRQTEGAAPQ